MSIKQAQGDLSIFGTDPGSVIAIKVLGIFVIMVVMTLLTIWAERRIVGRMQMRIGPNRVGPFGLLQSLMDGVKLALKEEIIPKGVHFAVYAIAPVIAVTAAFLTFAVIPFGPEVSILGHVTPLQLTDFPVSVLYVLAVASVGIYGIVLAGWSSGSIYPLLGGLRSSAQMISYEIAMGLSFVAVFLYAQSMSTSQIVAAQEPMWYIVLLLPSFIIYTTAMVGETNRAPFDLPEAEGELVAGFHTEYSSLKFALFFLGDSLRTCHHVIPWRLASAVANFIMGSSERRLVANDLVLRKSLCLHICIHLVTWNFTATSLRPIYEVWLESPDPSFNCLDFDCCDCSLPSKHWWGGVEKLTLCSQCSAVVSCHDLLRARFAP